VVGWWADSPGFAAPPAATIGWWRFPAKGAGSVPAAAGAGCHLRAKRFGEPRRSHGGGGSERAAHLVDRVLPDVPIRQWVLTLPFRLRYRLAWDHDLCRMVAGIFVRAVMAALRERAAWRGVVGGRSGGVTVIQRFGGALNLNVHFHALVLDGVFARGDAGTLSFHETPPLTTLDVAEVLAAIEPRLARVIGRRDAGGVEDAWDAEVPVLAGLAAASVQATGGSAPRRGVERGERIDADEATSERCLVRTNGLSLHAGVVVPAGQRARLEQVCRYVLRPPVASDRLAVAADGRVLVTLRRPWADGTSVVALDPLTFLGRLAVLVPRPRINLLLYQGVLGARSSWRAEVVQLVGASEAEATAPAAAHPQVGERRASPARGLRWAELMRRTFAFDVLACVRCGGRLRLIALIEQTAVITRILRHLGLPSEVPLPRAGRSPPPGSPGAAE